jgi:nitrate reductase NapA
MLGRLQTEVTGGPVAVHLAGLGGVNALGLGGWLPLEALAPKGRADEYHKSVCRYCGTGCGIRVGLRNGQITDIRGDERAHNRGVLCVKGATLWSLPHIPGRLTTPKIRRNRRTGCS